MIDALNRILIRIQSQLTGKPDWVMKGKVSSKGSELRNWNEKRLDIGTYIYLRSLLIKAKKITLI
jgi:hypothetical protein